MTHNFPKFDELPTVPNTPQGCLWGFYDKSEVVMNASSEIRIGRHLQLDWPLHSLKFPGFARRALQHQILDNHATLNEHAFDDEVYFNTQAGSQWDSLKHYAYQKGKVFYNGLTLEDAKISVTNGLHNICDRGGIVGRGVLVDMVRYWEKTGQCLPDPWSTYAVSYKELDAALADQGTQTRQGGILLIRSGYVKRHNEASDEERKVGTQGSQSIGLAPSEDTVRWLYSRHFAAVAGDTVGFEALPRDFENPFALHEWLLVFWGTPIGELWNLEGLSKTCEELNRWTFFLTSAPLNIRGGVGSPPGAIAIF
ncbi:hypothetical protein J7T55_000810 [Diaporthe amygdali]|uniref:uncharacterized protein n=1 Tax=Phomopsis amygdali TaxID=1214568 RepID=UPI0022FF1035|nr:uncharacterized protein J7T55_000810 [Diaporthe amygdali]KAJ0119960.1 hypothetical protein J7T55_000810 [Diaporthe amygdali]